MTIISASKKTRYFTDIQIFIFIYNDLLKVLIILVYLKRKKHSYMNYNLEEIRKQEELLSTLPSGSKVIYKGEEYLFLSFTRTETTFRETCPNTSTPEINYCIICNLQGKNGETIEAFSDEILVINP